MFGRVTITLGIGLWKEVIVVLVEAVVDVLVHDLYYLSFLSHFRDRMNLGGVQRPSSCCEPIPFPLSFASDSSNISGLFPGRADDPYHALHRQGYSRNRVGCRCVLSCVNDEATLGASNARKSHNNSKYIL